MPYALSTSGDTPPIRIFSGRVLTGCSQVISTFKQLKIPPPRTKYL